MLGIFNADIVIQAAIDRNHARMNAYLTGCPAIIYYMCEAI